MEDFKNRLKEFIEGYLGISVRAFEDGCGLTNGTVGSIKVKGPSVDVLMKISYAHPELNMNWLIAGRGAMIVSSIPSPSVNIEKVQTINIGNWSDFLGPITEQINNLRETINKKI